MEIGLFSQHVEVESRENLGGSATMSGKQRGGGGGGKSHARQSSASSGSGATINPSGQRVQNVKLVLLGDQGVGKSSIALRFVRGEFQENCEATIGAAFLTQTVNVGSQTIKFDIWDTAGQERYHSLAPMYYRGAQAAIVVYDVTNAKTFSKATAWIRELRQQANSQIIMVLAGNKADMASDKRAVSRDEAQSFAEENNLIFSESSAKTGMCVGEIFMDVAQSLARHGPAPDAVETAGLKLGKKPEKKRDCC